MTAATTRPFPYRLPLLFSLIVLFLVFAAQTTGFVKEGLSLCAHTVIPALFPHLVLSDLLSAEIGGQQKKGLTATLCRYLRLPSCTPILFLAGALCGFPIGARLAVQLQKKGVLSPESAKDLAAFTNNTSPAFLVGAVGASLFSSPRIGWLLLASQLTASFLCLVLTRPLRPALKADDLRAIEPKGAPSLVDAIRRAASTMLAISAFILFFSVVSGFVLLWFPRLALPLVSFLEVSNACRTASGIYASAPAPVLAWTAFAVGFGGLSASMQSAMCAKEAGISLKGYLPRKLLVGILTAIIFFVLTWIASV